VSLLFRIDIMAGFTPGDVERAAKALLGGGLGVIPTDTVYGIAALASNKEAVAKVFEIKQRSLDKPLPVHVASIREVNALAEADGAAAATLAARFWPGPLTIVLTRRTGPGTRLPLQPAESIGLRIPYDMFCLSLIEHAGYLVVPSANLPGAPSPRTLEDVPAGIIEQMDFVVNAGACPLGVESTVVDLIGEPAVLREGAVPAADVLEMLEGLGSA
jgi:L-threonylcarbamoyladenylate synthase